MKIWGIELCKSYYGYDCIDNGAFHLIRYRITEKSTGSFKARRLWNLSKRSQKNED